MAPTDHPAGFLTRFQEEERRTFLRLKPAAKAMLPASVMRWIHRHRNGAFTPPVGKVDFGDLHRVTPISRSFGIDRGGPIDRYYIDSFLERHRADIKGRVLEAGGFTNYTRRFGADRVTCGDILYPKPGFADGTLIGDLDTGEGIPSESFDCLIMTQVFMCTYGVAAAVATCQRALKPGGVLLATLPGISQICVYDQKEWGDYWRFTDASAARLFGDVFGPTNITLETRGNVLTACAFLHGLSARDLTGAELDHHDPQYQLSIAVRAVRAS